MKGTKNVTKTVTHSVHYHQHIRCSLIWSILPGKLQLLPIGNC